MKIYNLPLTTNEPVTILSITGIQPGLRRVRARIIQDWQSGAAGQGIYSFALADGLTVTASVVSNEFQTANGSDQDPSASSLENCQPSPAPNGPNDLAAIHIEGEIVVGNGGTLNLNAVFYGLVLAGPDNDAVKIRIAELTVV